MKTALVHPVPVTGAQRFVWTWCAEDGAAVAAQTFPYFYDCCQDARSKGYECRFDEAKPRIARQPLKAAAHAQRLA